MTRLALSVAAAATLLVACGGSGGHEGHTSGSADHQAAGSVHGQPADPSDADRTVEVTASDDLSFSPDRIEVERGEVITFVVRNEGSAEHEFVLGDADYQDAHASEMHDGAMMDEDNAVTLDPGASQELTWRFDESGEVLYGCHEAGHYDGGMVGAIVVE